MDTPTEAPARIEISYSSKDDRSCLQIMKESIPEMKYIDVKRFGEAVGIKDINNMDLALDEWAQKNEFFSSVYKVELDTPDSIRVVENYERYPFIGYTPMKNMGDNALDEQNNDNINFNDIF